MDLKLNGKLALVTGSTAGIGFDTATLLAQEGAKVIVNGRTAARVEAAISHIRETVSNADVVGFSGDLSQEHEALKLYQQFPRVDILVNNLGIYAAQEWSTVKDADFTNMFNTNVVSGARLSIKYLQEMKKAGWGRIIFISSETGINIPSDMLAYGVSKSAQIALARGLAEATVGTNITVNSILPGPTLSEGVQHFLDDVVKDSERPRSEIENEFIEKMRPTSLIKRFAQGEEVAALITYVASPLASATNGAALRVEGGLLRNAF